MKPFLYCATVLAWALVASPCGAKNLPEMTTLDAYIEFVQRTAGEAKDATEESGHFKSTIADIASIRFFEGINDDRDIDEIVELLLKSVTRSCDAFRLVAVGREMLDGMTLVRGAVRCVVMGVELLGEELIIADATRFHNYSIGGPMANRDKISAIAARMFDALVAAYR
jgi:hypothetical protein